MKTSDLNFVLEQLGIDPLAHGLQIVAARELAGEYFPRLDTDRPALVLQFDAPELLPRVVRTLRRNYPADHGVTIVRGAKQKKLALEKLALEKTTRNTALYLAPFAHPSSPLTLANIMAHLRSPVGGCPWDLEQTHSSITRALIEETYEVIEAISDDDMLHLVEELGDLQLHVLFQAQIARDRQEFALSDVGAELAAKLIRRHPHVFGEEQAHDADTVVANWEKIKQAEKARKGQTAPSNALDVGIPRELPALARAQKVHERARRQAPASGQAKAPRSKIAEQFLRSKNSERAVGEMLFELAALAEQHGIDAERALRAATKTFVEQKNDA